MFETTTYYRNMQDFKKDIFLGSILGASKTSAASLGWQVLRSSARKAWRKVDNLLPKTVRCSGFKHAIQTRSQSEVRPGCTTPHLQHEWHHWHRGFLPCLFNVTSFSRWCFQITSFDMGVSKNNDTPQISHSHRVFHYKPSILRYPYFWKHPYSISSLVDVIRILGLERLAASRPRLDAASLQRRPMLIVVDASEIR